MSSVPAQPAQDADSADRGVAPGPIRHAPCLPIGRVVALVGGLSLGAAYFMPWFAVQIGFAGANQTILLSGSALTQFLSNTSDLRRFVPGMSGDPNEARALRALVYLFPASGLGAAVLALLAPASLRLRRVVNGFLGLAGVVPLAALMVAMQRLPANATLEIGLQLIAAGAIGVVLGAVADTVLDGTAHRRSPGAAPATRPPGAENRF